MELTQEQIDELFRFTAKKYVHWHDLRTELVDHLASRIEEELEKDPKLDFNRALAQVYKGFGLFGFANIVKEKQAQLERSSRRLWWREFRRFFGWPEITLVLGSIWLLWQATHLLPADIMLPLVILAFVGTEVNLVLFRKKQRRSIKPLLLLETGPLRFASGFLVSFCFLDFGSATSKALFVFAMIALLCSLVNFASYRAHRKVQAEAETLYPDAFAAA